jgi:pimeloyl-ACP methyl ester carboxylesterase
MPGTIVMIHGAFSGGWCFANFADALDEHGWTCHAPDLRFHAPGEISETDPRLARTSIADYTADIAQTLQGLPEKPVLMGHSMGGVIAQQLAAQGHARALVLLASCAPWGILPSSAEERAVATGLMSAGPFWTQALHPVFAVAAKDSLANLDPTTQRQVFDRMGAESGRALFELFFWMFDGNRATEVDAERGTCPVLVIAGSQDKVISPETGRRIAGRYGDRATFHEAARHGHFLLVEPGWENVAQMCADWLGKVERGSPGNS